MANHSPFLMPSIHCRERSRRQIQSDLVQLAAFHSLQRKKQTSDTVRPRTACCLPFTAEKEADVRYSQTSYSLVPSIHCRERSRRQIQSDLVQLAAFHSLQRKKQTSDTVRPRTACCLPFTAEKEADVRYSQTSYSLVPSIHCRERSRRQIQSDLVQLGAFHSLQRKKQTSDTVRPRTAWCLPFTAEKEADVRYSQTSYSLVPSIHCRERSRRQIQSDLVQLGAFHSLQRKKQTSDTVRPRTAWCLPFTAEKEADVRYSQTSYSLVPSIHCRERSRRQIQSDLVQLGAFHSLQRKKQTSDTVRPRTAWCLPFTAEKEADVRYSQTSYSLVPSIHCRERSRRQIQSDLVQLAAFHSLQRKKPTSDTVRPRTACCLPFTAEKEADVRYSQTSYSLVPFIHCRERSRRQIQSDLVQLGAFHSLQRKKQTSDTVRPRTAWCLPFTAEKEADVRYSQTSYSLVPFKMSSVYETCGLLNHKQEMVEEITRSMFGL